MMLFFGNKYLRIVCCFVLLIDFCTGLKWGQAWILVFALTAFPIMLGKDAYDNGEEWAEYWWVDALICGVGLFGTMILTFIIEGV